MRIKEIAEKCGVSEQAVRHWCQKNGVAKDAKGRWVVDESSLARIFEYYRAVVPREAKGSFETCGSSESELVDQLRSEVEYLRSQIGTKDRQIADLSAALANAQETAKAAQVLQASERGFALESADRTDQKKRGRFRWPWMKDGD